MTRSSRTPFARRSAHDRESPWTDTGPVRAELFSVERLEQHARSLAAAQSVTLDPPRVQSLHRRLNENAALLQAAYRASVIEFESGRGLVPAAEWLVDNYFLVEEQIREIRSQLPIGFYRQLPKLEKGPLAGYPRIFGLAWAFVAHTDSHFDREFLERFLAAYQSVEVLTIGELWAVSITLRIVLIENLRRLADEITAARGEQEEAIALSVRLLESADPRVAFQAEVTARAMGSVSEGFAAQLAKSLRDRDPETTPTLGWLEDRLARQGTTINAVVQNVQQHQAASNVTVRNVITSMRAISNTAWGDVFEAVSLVDECLRDGSDFAAMDFPTRNRYRSAIEQLSRGSAYSEVEIAKRSLRMARAATVGVADPVEARRVGDPGYHLIAEGRDALELAIGFVPSLPLRFARLNVRLGMRGYGASIWLITILALTLAVSLASHGNPSTGWLVAFVALAFWPASDLAVALTNRLVAENVGALALPGLDLQEGIPPELRTLVVVPTLLVNEDEIREQVDRLEVHYLSGSGGDVYFALLSDWTDAKQETRDGDAAVLAIADEAIAALNRRHPPGDEGPRFLLLHRRRVFSASEQCWMGRERKRGKLEELNRLLRGARQTTFLPNDGDSVRVPRDVRYVVTLDADTRLPRDAAVRMVGKMGHPLNRPQFDRAERRVVHGYGILQPRVMPALPIGSAGTLFQRAFGGNAGMDPYASAASDVYQDLFGEGSFTGKGIYDVDAFEAALADRVPEGALLSHDLFEGIFARAGLASDVAVVEDFPARYDVAVKRQHRWTRGDWQLLPWALGHWRGSDATPTIGRWKMIDNLRRSLVAPATVLALALCWLLPRPTSWTIQTVLLAALAIPVVLPTFLGMFTPRKGVLVRSHARAVGADLKLAAMQIAMTIAFLADQAWNNVDAILRTFSRVFVSRRHLLEWTTAAQAARARTPGLAGSYRAMSGGVTVAVLLAGLAAWRQPTDWAPVVPLALLWLLAPWIALRVSRPLPVAAAHTLTPDERRTLRLTARRTWRYFETFVGADEHMLPPDNFQESPRPVVAHRTSPTNIGLYLLAAVAARDFGWAGTIATIERIEQLFATLRRLPRFRGHLFNWYATEDLRPLDPQYVSSVDSGNFAGHLIVLANACEEWLAQPVAETAATGLRDAFDLAREALAGHAAPSDADAGADDEADAQADARQRAAALPALDAIGACLASDEPLERIAQRIRELGLGLLAALPRTLPATSGAAASFASVGPIPSMALPAATVADVAHLPSALDVRFWIEALVGGAEQHLRDRQATTEERAALAVRIYAIAAEARSVAMAMDFAFLVDEERKLLSIGYSLADNRLDRNCYDLLASEARLASLFAIAKGDVPTRHWFQLGRASVPVGTASALVSWAGSMFEYLMPSLVMRAPLGSLLEQTNRLVVERQRSYAASRNVPWGISESAYNARDIEFTYQYSTFGVPGLGLKRGLADNLVIAPYATALATMVDPRAALVNFAALAEHGAVGRYGFYEALDFTRARVPQGASAAVVRNFMAHHQGMTIVAIANAIDAGRMRARFHREPMIHASELLLQERSPRDVAIPHLRSEALRTPAHVVDEASSSVRRTDLARAGPPVTHLLSNGRYTVMLTAAGGGFSRWRDLAITRWREDGTSDANGSFVFLRDLQSGAVWSATGPTTIGDETVGEAIFSEDRAAFVRREGRLTTTMDVLVSGEDDGEVRRVMLINSGRRPREIELTTYAELVLTTPATDNAHPAFAKMFVQTEYEADLDALIATRRVRGDDEAQVWVAHFGIVDGDVMGPVRFESDRARFIGRGRSLRDAQANGEDGELSNTVGTVLDPIFALRYRVRVPPGRSVEVDFWTLVASTRDELLDVIDRHRHASAFDRATTYAWTQAQVQLRHLGIKAEAAADFQRLAAPILYVDRRFRPPSDVIGRGAGPQSALWANSISGDLPIVLLRIDDTEDIESVRQLLRAHEYWRSKRLEVDLVVLNERAASYVQDLQIAIDTAVRSSQSRPRIDESSTRGAVFALRADLIAPATRALLLSIARVVLVARRGSLAAQLLAIPAAPDYRARRGTPVTPRAEVERPRERLADSLEFFNGTGGFGSQGREYVTILNGRRATPAPWINVVANAAFGFQASADGSGFTWAENSRDNQITPWSNDAVVDPSREAFYVRDEISGDVWSPTARPIRDGGTYIARHGFGYCRFEHEVDGIALELLQYVSLDDPIKISRLTIRNRSGRARRLSVTSYAEWVLGTSRAAGAPYLTTEIDRTTGALLASNPWNITFPGRVAFSDLAGAQTSWTADRAEFLGWGGSAAAPAALTGGAALSGRTGAGLDPCGVLQRIVELPVDGVVEIVHFLGQKDTAQAVADLVTRYRAADLDAVLAKVTDHWTALLRTIQVRTPDRAMDIMLNGWLLYQTMACRIWARSAFYQASGAYGFRDQLQDGMALTFARPAQTRAHLLRAASRQFPEGDVQHWWLPHSGQGVRTRISDDRVWLAYAVATYVQVSGDLGVLDEQVPFLEGRALEPGQHDAFYLPDVSSNTASVFEHCALGLDQCLALTGPHGLPLMGTGDWNDGMNRVGQDGRGESVWLAWLLIRTIDLFAPHADARDPARATRWRAHAGNVSRSIERAAWDGRWYRRATFDDGTWLGTSAGDECRIDSIAQSWAVLSRAADPTRAATAMASLEEMLVRRREGMALLFTPPFDHTAHDPGYIKGYPPGLRENGGQYTHAAMWVIFAHARSGAIDKAVDLFGLLNPINHALTHTDVRRYRVEPYVVAADVYSVAPHVGRGGWTWYTGSAAWMYRSGVDAILGITREGDTLVLTPRLPQSWPMFEATITEADAVYEIVVRRLPSGPRERPHPIARLDAVEVAFDGDALRLAMVSGTHRIEVGIV